MICYGLVYVCVRAGVRACVHEQKSGHFREDGEISASLNKSNVILFQYDLIAHKQTDYIVHL